jgi:hypothetical protein
MTDFHKKQFKGTSHSFKKKLTKSDSYKNFDKPEHDYPLLFSGSLFGLCPSDASDDVSGTESVPETYFEGADGQRKVK